MILNMTLLSPHFPQFIGRKWKRRRASLGLFWVQPRASPPAGGFLEIILIAEILFVISGKRVNGKVAGETTIETSTLKSPTQTY